MLRGLKGSVRVLWCRALVRCRHALALYRRGVSAPCVAVASSSRVVVVVAGGRHVSVACSARVVIPRRRVLSSPQRPVSCLQAGVGSGEPRRHSWVVVPGVRPSSSCGGFASSSRVVTVCCRRVGVGCLGRVVVPCCRRLVVVQRVVYLHDVVS